MKIFNDVFFWIVIATVTISTLPQLTGYIPEAVINVVTIVLGAVLIAIKMYQTKQAYKEGSMGIMGSKYK